MSIMAKTPSGYKKIGSAYLGERPVDKVFNANGDVIYALQRELTGVPPLLFKGKEQSELLNYRICGNTETKQRDYSGSSPLTVPVHDGELYNYRIYGNTVNGESVGEKTGNLFEAELVNYNVSANGQINALTDFILSIAPVIAGTTYTISNNQTSNVYAFYQQYPKPESYSYNSSRYVFNENSITIVAPIDGYIVVRRTASNPPIMLNTGSTPLPYEPYGYKVPITVTNSGTTSNETIYLPEPIKMVGSEAEYVDFYSQKQYFADGTNTAVTIPTLPISAGTNTVTVNTTVQPSNVEVSIDENVSVGDLVTSGQHAGEYKVPVTVEGKNLFDGEIEQGGYDIYGLNVDNELRLYRVRGTNYIPVVGGETYNLHAVSISPLMYHISYYTKNDYTTQRFGYVGWTRNTVFTTPSDCKYIRLLFKTLEDSVIAPDDISNIMLNSGSTPLPYEPYHAPVTTPIYLPEPIKMVGDEAEYIDYGEQKQHRVRKNLLRNTTTSQTMNGVTFTVNADGSVTCNGTASKAIYFSFATNLESGTYIISGTPRGMTENNAVIFINANYSTIGLSNNVIDNDGNGKQFVATQSGTATLTITIKSGYTCDNLTFYPMIRKADIEDDTYEPYIKNTDLNVTLPALPTIKGTNQMSIDTEVQPSRMDIKGRIKSLT